MILPSSGTEPKTWAIGANAEAPTRTLVVHGERDPVISRADVRVLRALPNADFLELSSHGHFAPLTAARRFNEELASFLTKDERPPSSRVH